MSIIYKTRSSKLSNLVLLQQKISPRVCSTFALAGVVWVRVSSRLCRYGIYDRQSCSAKSCLVDELDDANRGKLALHNHCPLYLFRFESLFTERFWEDFCWEEVAKIKTMSHKNSTLVYLICRFTKEHMKEISLIRFCLVIGVESTLIVKSSCFYTRGLKSALYSIPSPFILKALSHAFSLLSVLELNCLLRYVVPFFWVWISEKACIHVNKTLNIFFWDDFACWQG